MPTTTAKAEPFLLTAIRMDKHDMRRLTQLVRLMKKRNRRQPVTKSSLIRLALQEYLDRQEARGRDKQPSLPLLAA